jgi:hypothetical protein
MGDVIIIARSSDVPTQAFPRTGEYGGGKLGCMKLDCRRLRRIK